MENIWTTTSNSRYTNEGKIGEKYEVCIVGAGLTGLYSALLLAKNGHQVALFEASPEIGQGATSFSTGKLTAQHGAIYHKLQPELQTIYNDENQRAIEELAILLPSNTVSQCHSFLYSRNEKDTKTLKKELHTYETLHLPCYSTTECELPFDIHYAIALKNQFQVNPYECLIFLAQEAVKNGAVIYTNSRVQHVDHTKNTITVCEQTVQFQHLILATHYPIDAIPALQLLKLANSRSYLCAAPFHDSLQHQYLDIGSESRTIRSTKIHDKHYLLYGGTHHLAGSDINEVSYYKTIEREMQQYFNLPDVPYQWSNQDVQTFDELPFVGPINSTYNTIYIATGYNKWGLSQSIVAAQILLKAIQKQSHPLMPYFTPERFKPIKMLEVAAYTMGQFLSGYITRTHTPICTHLGCHTRWNEADQTWDCPCHGSRFKENGEIIEGPAVEPLNISDHLA